MIGGLPVSHVVAAGTATSVFAVRGPDGILAAKVAHTRAAAEQLSREAKVLRRLEHPAILRPHGTVRTDNGEMALLMDLLDGVSAQSRVKALARPGWAARTREAVHVARGIADALGHVHARGLVHRDIKGTNVFVRDDGHVWLLDFGIAAELSGEGTDYGIFVGTIPCAAPEQVAGGILSEATDVFGLGAMLYRLLTARRPWEATTPAGLMEAHRAGLPPSPHALVPSVPRMLSDLCMRMMAIDPTARPSTAEVTPWLAHLETHLDRFIAQDPGGGLPPRTVAAGQDTDRA